MDFGADRAVVTAVSTTGVALSAGLGHCGIRREKSLLMGNNPAIIAAIRVIAPGFGAAGHRELKAPGAYALDPFFLFLLFSCFVFRR